MWILIRLTAALINPRAGLSCCLALSGFLYTGHVSAQDVLSYGILSIKIPTVAYDLRSYNIRKTDTCESNPFKNEIVMTFEYDDILRYRDVTQRFITKNQVTGLEYTRYLSDRRYPLHRINMKIEYQQSSIRHHAIASENKIDSKNSFRLYELSYSRELFGPFSTEINLGRAVGLNNSEFTYGAGLRFEINKLKWGLNIKNKFNSHYTSIQYQSENVDIPIDYVQRESQFYIGLNRLYGIDLKLYYDSHQYDSKQKTINQMSAKLDGISELYGFNFSTKIDQMLLFTDFSRETYEYTIYTYKNKMQYGKINVPRVTYVRLTTGIELNGTSGNGYAGLYQYIKGKEHIGLIIETWPFSSGIGGLLGVKYYNDLDGSVSVHQFFLKKSFSLNSSNTIVPQVAMVLFQYDGKYSYRKQDGLFNVYDSGTLVKSKMSQFIKPGIIYHLTSSIGEIIIETQQLIPVQAGNILSNNNRSSARGGFFITLKGIFRF